MTNAEAWTTFKADGSRLLWPSRDGYACGLLCEGTLCSDGTGPTPEAAIADAFGETLED